jgi:class 3 adenylate cyclase
MNCPSCGASVAQGAKFCGKCGTALPRACSACGHTNPPDDKFCSECGASLSPGSSRAAASTPLPPAKVLTATSAERRQITVLFCDLVGSTALASRLDAEDLRDIIGTYHRCCAEIVAKFDGSVAQYLGDGVMARFGYPKAHEDDADRAVRCGLDMIKAVAALKVPNESKLEVRIGIATGVVVVGDQSTSEVGETPNLAARLQAMAEPGSIVIADSTKKLIGDLFESRD